MQKVIERWVAKCKAEVATREAECERLKKAHEGVLPTPAQIREYLRGVLPSFVWEQIESQLSDDGHVSKEVSDAAHGWSADFAECTVPGMTIRIAKDNIPMLEGIREKRRELAQQRAACCAEEIFWHAAYDTKHLTMLRRFLTARYGKEGPALEEQITEALADFQTSITPVACGA